uniref:Uncharacterized protein n=1 Tax=Anguilla anguilla TaxID=7936 RepID=A0A0E9TUP3_ANGAN
MVGNYLPFDQTKIAADCKRLHVTM